MPYRMPACNIILLEAYLSPGKKRETHKCDEEVNGPFPIIIYFILFFNPKCLLDLKQKHNLVNIRFRSKFNSSFILICTLD